MQKRKSKAPKNAWNHPSYKPGKKWKMITDFVEKGKSLEIHGFSTMFDAWCFAEDSAPEETIARITIVRY